MTLMTTPDAPLLPTSTPRRPPALSPLGHTSSGGRLVATDGRVLPLRSVALQAAAEGGLAAVTLQQVFHNPHAAPLRVTWSVPLPLDAAVSGFAFTIDEERVVGVIDARARARERFEEALIEGRTAALLEEDRATLFRQEVGNIPPGATVVCELQLDQHLSWRDAGWEWRFPTVVAPRFLGQEGRVADAARITQDIEATEPPTNAPITMALRIADPLQGRPSSPSHGLFVREGSETVVELGDAEGVTRDRDLVVRWPVAAQAPGATLQVASPQGELTGSAYGLLSLVPPAPSADQRAIGRDLCVLLDTSGSMGGPPLDAARAVVLALIDTLTAADTLEMVEFSTRPRRWKAGVARATAEARADAAAWVRALRAGGGTRMRDGILAALRTERPEARRQILLITDGLIGFEREVVSAVANQLPRGCRVHTLGVGSAVNRALTGPVARAGGGVEHIVGLDESPARAAARLVAATDAPLVVDLTLSGPALIHAAMHRLPDLCAGQPTRVPVALAPEGGELVVCGTSADGPWEQRVRVPATAVGSGSPALSKVYARAQVDDLELRAATGEQVDAEIERIGLQHQVATRMTSWVAINQAARVDPRAPGREEHVPQALPYGMSVAGLGLRAPTRSRLVASPAPEMQPTAFAAMAPPPAPRQVRASKRARRRKAAPPAPPKPPAPSAPPKPGPTKSAGLLSKLGALFGGRRALRLEARVDLTKDGRVVLTVTPAAALAWALPERLTLTLPGGEPLDVALLPAESTAPGPVAPGQTLRLAIRTTLTVTPGARVDVQLPEGRVVHIEVVA